jgi:hypothetical protein
MDKINRNLLFINVILMVFSIGIIFLNGCDGGSGSSTSSATSPDPISDTSTEPLIVRASNVIFRDNSAYAREVVSEEQVYADNVIVDKSNTTLDSENVQDAFEETNPVLSEIIIGTWDVTSFKSADGGDPSISTGTITFYEDGTFESTGAVEMFGWVYSSEFADATPDNYQIFNDKIISLSYKEYGQQNYHGCMVTGFDKITPNQLVVLNNDTNSGYATKREN